MVFFSEEKKTNLNLVFFPQKKFKFIGEKKPNSNLVFFLRKKNQISDLFFFSIKKNQIWRRKKKQKKTKFFFRFFSHMDGPNIRQKVSDLSIFLKQIQNSFQACDMYLKYLYESGQKKSNFH